MGTMIFEILKGGRTEYNMNTKIVRALLGLSLPVGIMTFVGYTAKQQEVKSEQIIEHADFRRSWLGNDYVTVFNKDALIGNNEAIDVKKDSISVNLVNQPAYPTGGYSLPYAQVTTLNNGYTSVKYFAKNPAHDEMVKIESLEHKIDRMQSEKLTEIGRKIDLFNEK